MDYKHIKKNEIHTLLDGLIGEYEVFAPVIQDGIVVFDAIKSGDGAVLDFSNTVKPPKETVFRQVETLLVCNSPNDAASVTDQPAEHKQAILFAVRPCDAKSLLFLDRVFNDEKNYDRCNKKRRDALIVISLGCTQPRETCFCTTTGGGPFSPEGADVMLVDCGDDYIAQPITDKGEAFLKEYKLTNAPQDEIDTMNSMIRQNNTTMDPALDINRLKGKLDNSFECSVWDTLAEKCLSCGICTYLCPACHCFDIVDEVKDGKAERIRIWDSCQFPHFTLQASGFNPRPTFKERYRQRIMHKFSYCIDNYHMAGCVGCGRCVSECPVNLDIRRILCVVYNQ